MRQIMAIVFLSLAAVFSAYAGNNDDVQQGIFNSYLKLANDGDTVAQYVVAQGYENGRGTEKDMEKAYYWYEKAAKQNYPLAVVKLEERRNQQEKSEQALEKKPRVTASAPAAENQVEKPAVEKPLPGHKQRVAKPKPKLAKAPSTPVPPPPVQVRKPEPPAPIARQEEIKQEAKPATPVVVVKAPVIEEPPAPALNVIQTLLAGKWKHNQQQTEFLPSSRAACLQSSGTEVVCFSQELTRNIDHAGLTYSVKSVITGTDNKQARFTLRYIYNVVHVADKPYSQPDGMPSEANDMVVKTGWQEPGITMDCHLRDEHSLSCTRADRKLTYQFVRE